MEREEQSMALRNWNQWLWRPEDMSQRAEDFWKGTQTTERDRLDTMDWTKYTRTARQGERKSENRRRRGLEKQRRKQARRRERLELG